MGRVSREQAAVNRSRIVAVASSMFRRRGLDGVGIDEVMAEAGLTRGGFYGQFGSKDDLAREACTYAFDSAEGAWQRILGDGNPGRLRELAAFYFAPKIDGCPMALLATDAARAPVGGPVRQAFTAGLRRLTALIAGEKPDDKALALLAAMVGAAVLRRASEDVALADTIEAAVLKLAER